MKKNYTLICMICAIISSTALTFAETTNRPPSLKEGNLSGDIILVNLKTIEAPFILKEYQFIRIGGKVFLRGIQANIGNDEKEAGLTVNVAIDDISAIREFSWSQAKSYYGELFREKRKS